MAHFRTFLGENMVKFLVIVDFQNDFITGALGTPEAEKIVPSVANKVRNWEDCIVTTVDTHDENYLNTNEGKHLPIPHCIGGTWGHQIRAEVSGLLDVNNYNWTIRKDTFGSMEAAEYIETFCELCADEGEELQIELIGLCTDICVISNALILKAQFPDAKISVDASCCAGTTPDRHRAALEVMKSCQIEVLNDA